MAEGNGVARLNLWLSVAGGIFVFLLPMLGGAYWLASLDARVGSLERSSTTISALDDRVTANEHAVSDLRQWKTDGCQQFAKVETQFGTVEEVMNDLHVNEVRDKKAVWLKVFGAELGDQYHEISIPHEIQPCN
jgi:hypothetical protein